MSDFNVGFVIFPGITQLDFTDPFEVLSRLGTPPSLSAASKFPRTCRSVSRMCALIISGCETSIASRQRSVRTAANEVSSR